MTYKEYFKTFNKNDIEHVVQHVPNSKAEKFLLENAPRFYCPNADIEETFAFRTWTMRKHVKKTDAGFLLTEFLTKVQLPWAGKYNVINAPLTHHLNEFRWLKNADLFLDYISYFIKGEGSINGESSAFNYHTPALTAIYDFCVVTANEKYLLDNLSDLEKYFQKWEDDHGTKNGLYWSIDDREGTEYTISGTTPNKEFLKGFRPLLNACMYGDAVTLSKIQKMAGNVEKEQYYLNKAREIKNNMDKKMWDGTFYKAVHPTEQNLDIDIDYKDIPEDLDAKELVGYIPWAFNMPDKGKEEVFKLLKDEKTFKGTTGFTTADISNPRFMYPVHKACCWNGKVWPYATSYVINAVIELLDNYDQNVLTEKDLYEFIEQYAKMHYLYCEDGNRINFIDEVMLPFRHIWHAHELLKINGCPEIYGGPDRGRDYNHSTYIDLVIRGLCGIKLNGDELIVKPKIKGIWKWFKLENLSIRKQTYNIYYDEDGSKFNKGKGVIIERI